MASGAAGVLDSHRPIHPRNLNLCPQQRRDFPHLRLRRRPVFSGENSGDRAQAQCQSRVCEKRKRSDGPREAEWRRKAFADHLRHEQRRCQALDPDPKLKTKLKKGTSIIGFLSHVQGDLKQKAHEVGCDMVLPRSAFSQNLPQLLRRHGAPEEGQKLSRISTVRSGELHLKDRCANIFSALRSRVPESRLKLPA